MTRKPLDRTTPWMIAALAVGTLACKGGTKSSPSPSPTPEPTTPAVPSPPAAPDATEPTTMPTPTPMPAADVASLATASNAFGFDLWARLRTTGGNLAVSPASISAALAMTWAGARGDTAAEMQRVMHVEGDVATASTSWGRLAAQLQAPERTLVLRIANRLFGEKTYTFEAPYLERTRDGFGAELLPIDFKNAPEPAREKINGWVEHQTETRIRDLLPPRSITADTRLVLVNAIYFLADWLEPFKKEATRPAPFTLAAGKPKTVPMMHAQASHRYAKADGVALLELPYKGGDTSMLLVLPDKVDGLAAVEQRLDAKTFTAWRAALQPERVAVTLPRFKIDPAASLELRKHLAAMGMPRAFDAAKADFTAIANPPSPADRLYIGAVFHKAFVKVDEKGTEAAAATAVVMPRAGAAPMKAIEFTADHPFLFFIVDHASGLVLFMGRVAEPVEP